MTRSIASFLTLLFILASCKETELAGNMTNPAFDKEKIPRETEPELKLDLAKEAWERATAIKAPCDSHHVWSARSTDSVRAIAFKNKDLLPVKGLFDRAHVYVVKDKKTGEVKGGGFVDLSSYNTGNDARDRRVMRYIFDIENEVTSPVAEFHFLFSDWKDEGSWSTTLDTKVAFRGTGIDVKIPVTVSHEGGAVTLKTDKDTRFTYATPAFKAGLLKIMELCNHGSMATFADVAFELKMPKFCK